MSDGDFWSLVYGEIGLSPSDLCEMSFFDLYVCVQGRLEYNLKKEKNDWMKFCYLISSVAAMMGQTINPSDLMPFEDYHNYTIPEVPQSDWDRLESLMGNSKKNGRG